MRKLFRAPLGLAIALLLSTTLLAPPLLSQSAVKPAAASTNSSSALLDINTATAAQLKSISGIGDAYAARIIAGRPYAAKNQLVSRGVLPANTYNKIKTQIVATQPKKK